jgi:hypothetical protein
LPRRLDQLTLLGEVQLDLRLGQQLLDPAGELSFERRARHLCRRRDIHMLQHHRLDLRFRRLDQRPVGHAAMAERLRVGRARGEQLLQDRRDQIAPRQRVGVDRVAHEMRLHRGIDQLGELAAAQEASALGANFARKARDQLVFGGREPIFERVAAGRRGRGRGIRLARRRWSGLECARRLGPRGKGRGSGWLGAPRRHVAERHHDRRGWRRVRGEGRKRFGCRGPA